MHRFATVVLAATVALSTPALAQQSVPPAAPTIGASGGLGGGIAIPIGELADKHTAGYTLMGLVDYSSAEQPFSFRFELIYQRYDKKSAFDTVSAVHNMNMMSLGASLLARSPKHQSSAFLLGGIAVYHLTDQGTKPGINAGFGLEVPLTSFIGIADVRIHYVLTESKPTLTIPITLGVRF